MYTKVIAEQQVQILSPSFSISPSNEDYVLNISANGRDFSPLFAVSAGVTRLVSNVAPGSYYKLVGNRSEVVINWQRMCATEGGADLSAYWTSAQTKDYVDSASTVLQDQIDTMDEVVSEALVDLNERIGEISGSSVDLSAYWTSAETQSAITAVEDHLFDVEEVTASALTELHDGVLELSAATAGKADAANIGPNTGSRLYFPRWNEQGIVLGGALSEMFNRELRVNGDAKSYITQSNYGNLAFYAPTTSGNPGEVLVSTGNGAPVWSAMPAADVTKAYVDSAITEVQDQIDTMDEVISDALNDLNGELASKVSSSSVAIVWKGTQAEYDAATQSGTTADPATLYIIV